MRVDRLRLTNFTVFGEAEIPFSPGLNVFIGANGTGKSHVLKVLYSILRPIVVAGPEIGPNMDLCKEIGLPVLQKLQKTFRPEPKQSALTSLIRRGADEAQIAVDGNFGEVSIRLGGPEADTNFQSLTSPRGLAVFAPANEVLSMYPGFVSAYERRELSFDETYRDLCVDLSANPLRSISPPAFKKLLAKLDDSVGGKTVLQASAFYVSLAKDWLLEASLLAEGLRKLASIAHLIRNGSLSQHSVLFWDEPESNINPNRIPLVAELLLQLAGAGVQVFVATHDFLLSNELSLGAEYETEAANTAQLRFFAFSKPDAVAPVQVESGGTLADLQHNPILDEFAAHYDREQSLFKRS